MKENHSENCILALCHYQASRDENWSTGFIYIIIIGTQIIVRSAIAWSVADLKKKRGVSFFQKSSPNYKLADRNQRLLSDTMIQFSTIILDT